MYDDQIKLIHETAWTFKRTYKRVHIKLINSTNEDDHVFITGYLISFAANDRHTEEFYKGFICKPHRILRKAQTASVSLHQIFVR
jgi:hypothetical protein